MYSSYIFFQKVFQSKFFFHISHKETVHVFLDGKITVSHWCMRAHIFHTGKGRFVTFYKSLINSNKVNVRFLANLNRHDQRTLLGRNLKKLCDLAECDPEQLSASVVKKNVKYKEVPEVDSWRVPMLQELLMSRDGELTIKNLDQSEITELIDDICIS